MASQVEFSDVKEGSAGADFLKYTPDKDVNFLVLTKPCNFPSTLTDVKERYVLGVWNIVEGKVQIADLKKTILKSLKKYSAENVDWNKLRISVSRKGTTKNDTEYTVAGFPYEGLPNYAQRQQEALALIDKVALEIQNKGGSK